MLIRPFTVFLQKVAMCSGFPLPGNSEPMRVSCSWESGTHAGSIFLEPGTLCGFPVLEKPEPMWVLPSQEHEILYEFPFLRTRNNIRVFLLCNLVYVPLSKTSNQFYGILNFSREQFENMSFYSDDTVWLALKFFGSIWNQEMSVLVWVFENIKNLVCP